MSITPFAIAGAGISAAATLLIKHEHDIGVTAERLAAAALETLLNAIDANDPETGAHVRRVAAYALVLADAMELDESSRRLVEQVALFHDIGKIHEALFDIVREDRKLTRSERRAIDTHPQRGADVLAPLCGFYPDLPSGVLAHHEHWNGKGYPKKLKGKKIPIAARVVSIADTFDAITYRRRYHEGQPPQVALDIINSKRGTQFDPELVDLFSFPPVFETILECEAEVSHWPDDAPRHNRNRQRDDVPEITFRWRPAQAEGHGRQKRGRGTRRVR